MTTKKRQLLAREETTLRGLLQTATLAALMDSRRWLPSIWPVSTHSVAPMLTCAIEQLQRGIDTVRKFQAPPQHG